MNPEHFESTETLRNGIAVTMRAIRPADKDALAKAFGRLAPESNYTRFFQARQSLSDQELKAPSTPRFR